MVLGLLATTFTRSTASAFAQRVSMSASGSAARRVLVPIADASEEIEFTTIADTLVRSGAEVTVASVKPGSLQVKLSRGVNVVADISIAEAVGQEYDLVVCPGGSRFGLACL